MKNNIKTMRERRKLTRQDCAELFEVTLRAWQTYEQGVSEPKYELLCRIADKFDTSLDYLLGRSEDAGTLLDRVQTDEELPFEARVLAAAYLSLGKEDRERLMSMVKEQREKLSEDERIEVPTGDLPDPQKDSETSSSA
jgi:transcriptional regulator with XRE-family HTH domain